MTAPSIRSMGTVTSGSTGAPSFAEPAGAAADDIIVCVWNQDDGRTAAINPTPPTGFLPAFDAPQVNDVLGGSPSHSLQVWVARRSVCGAGPYVFTIIPGTGGATPFCEGMAVAVQGVDVSAVYPYTDAADGNTSGNTSVTTAPAVSATSLDADRLALYFATNWTGGAWTPPGGYTEDWDANNRIATLDHLTMATASTTSPQAVCAGSDRSNAWVGIFPSASAAAPASGGARPSLPPRLLLLLAARAQQMYVNASAAAIVDATVTPAAVTGAVVVPVPTITTQSNATATPATVTGSAILPTPTVTAQTNQTATPSAVTGAAVVPSPTVTAQTNRTAAPSVVSATVGIATPTISAASNATTTPSTIVGSTTVPSPTVTAATSRVVTPTVISATVNIPTPIVSSVLSATIAAPTLACLVVVASPVVIVGAASVGVIGNVGDLDHDVPGALVVASAYATAGVVAYEASAGAIVDATAYAVAGSIG